MSIVLAAHLLRNMLFGPPVELALVGEALSDSLGVQFPSAHDFLRAVCTTLSALLHTYSSDLSYLIYLRWRSWWLVLCGRLLLVTVQRQPPTLRTAISHPHVLILSNMSSDSSSLMLGTSAIDGSVLVGSDHLILAQHCKPCITRSALVVAVLSIGPPHYHEMIHMPYCNTTIRHMNHFMLYCYMISW